MSLLSARFRRFLGRLARSWVLFAAIGLVVGLLVAPYAFSATAPASPGTVAIVPIEGGIDGQTAAGVSAALKQARNDPSIDAVVLVSNSPGGSAPASETLYLEVARTAEEMPVVASVDAMAASGSYYAVAPADHIYAKPSSLVGSVGVIATTPQDPQPIDLVTASGPKKLSGGNARDWGYKVDSLRRAFVGAVYESRGDNITIARDELSEAGLFTGAEAVQHGLVDDIGGTSEAVRDAARRAGLDDYEVRTLRPTNRTTFLTQANYVASSADNKTMVPPTRFVGDLSENPAVPNILMVPPSVIAAAVEDAEATAAPNATTRNESAARRADG